MHFIPPYMFPIIHNFVDELVAHYYNFYFYKEKKISSITTGRYTTMVYTTHFQIEPSTYNEKPTGLRDCLTTPPLKIVMLNIC